MVKCRLKQVELVMAIPAVSKREVEADLSQLLEVLRGLYPKLAKYSFSS